MTREEEIASDPRVIRCTCGQSGYDEGARIIAYAGWFEPASGWVAWTKSFAAYTGPRVLRLAWRACIGSRIRCRHSSAVEQLIRNQ